MKNLTWTGLFVILALSGCSIVDVAYFKHEPTDRLREAVDGWYPSAPKIPKIPRSPALDDALPVLIPDFFGFYPNGGGPADFFVISRSPTPIIFEAVSITDPTTGDTVSFQFSKEVKPTEAGKDRWLSLARLAYLNGSATSDTPSIPREKFAESKQLRVSVRWRQVGEVSSRESTFDLERRIRKDAAWVT